MTTMTNDAPSTIRPPAPVRIAVASVLTGVVLHVIGAVVGALVAHASPRAVERAARQGLGSSATPELVRTVSSVGSVISIVGTVLVCGLGVFFAMAMYRGRNWARVTLTVFAALELVSTLVAVAQTVFGRSSLGAEASTIVAVVRVLIGVTTVVFLASAYRAPAGKFFARRRPAPIG